MGRREFVVVKDPLSRAYYYFSEREWSILELLDGERSLTEIVSECAKRFAPDFVSPQALLQFVADARSKGLLRGGGAPPVGAPQFAWLRNPLAIRMPGINPDALLGRVATTTQWSAAYLTSPVFWVVWLVAIAGAAMTVLVHFESFSQHVGQAASQTSLSWWLLIASVVSVTKIVHELAHAMCCKLFGGECRELGVMFLVGVPCLYCDVSDAWMIPQRWKRVLISAAGMLAELTIATFAVVAWRFLDAGVARDVCVSIIVVCSVSTLLFNGNPLLRYDGYFILSDLVGIPNLASQARQLIRNWVRRFVWALPRVGSGESERPGVPVWHRSFFVGYGLLSAAYRMLIMFTLGSIAYGWLSSYGLNQLATFLVLGLVVAVAYRMVKPLLHRPEQADANLKDAGKRQVMLVAVGAVSLVLILLVPLPRHITVPSMVQATNAKPVYVATQGQVVDAVAYQSDVSEGDVLANLVNPDMVLQLAKQTTRRNEMRAQIDGLRKQQVSRPELASQIPATADLLASVTQRCQVLQESVDELVIRSPSSGRFYPPSNLLKADQDEVRQTWAGTPLQPSNRSAFLTAGTLVGHVGHPTDREAILLVDQADITLMQIGQSVSLLLPNRSRGSVLGKVTEVSPTPIETIPREFYASELIALPSHLALQRPAAAYYQVRVELGRSAATLAVRSTSQARIRVRSASLFRRIAEALAN
ncbi:Peptidase family M50 [Planctomycetes bacterium K23_9]|uniref:Peptidase family M50 n=2 Tax=Stieleria marina TaxID=1930275 RepID=A0A517NZS2_9BACT|nr:Peptidase family M50 [Planctomycetes bacterium K23_9]